MGKGAQEDWVGPCMGALGRVGDHHEATKLGRWQPYAEMGMTMLSLSTS